MFTRDWFNYPTSAWRELDRLQRHLNRLVDDFRLTGQSHFPTLNVWMKDDTAVVTAELPGVNSDAIDISIQRDMLTLKGARQAPAAKEDETYHRRERFSGEFIRTVQLPFEVEADRVEARFDKGVLTIALPRSEAFKPRKIAIKN